MTRPLNELSTGPSSNRDILLQRCRESLQGLPDRDEGCGGSAADPAGILSPSS